MRSVAEVCEKLVDVSENIGTIGKLVVGPLIEVTPGRNLIEVVS